MECKIKKTIIIQTIKIFRIQPAILLRISIGIVFIWFGGLKFIPDASPAQDLAIKTIEIITFGIFSNGIALILLAILEVGLGFCLLFNIQPKLTLYVLISHILCTFAPLILFPYHVFQSSKILYPTLLGQYVIKNIIIISAALVLIKRN